MDAERRVLGGNTGYLAFEDLPSSRLDELVAGTSQKTGVSARAGAVVYRDGGGVQVAARPRSSAAAPPSRSTGAW